MLSRKFLLLLCLALPSWAQTGASLSGAVTDPKGAGIPEVAVTIKNVDTGATRTIATDAGDLFPSRLIEQLRLILLCLDSKNGGRNSGETASKPILSRIVKLRIQDAYPGVSSSNPAFIICAEHNCQFTSIWFGMAWTSGIWLSQERRFRASGRFGGAGSAAGGWASGRRTILPWRASAALESDASFPCAATIARMSRD